MSPLFTEILRRHLKYLPDSQILAPDSPLPDLGLDSMETVALVVELEDEYEIMFADYDMVAGTFRTPASLWRALNAAKV